MVPGIRGLPPPGESRLLDPERLLRVLNDLTGHPGGAETEYFVPIRLGDVITSSSKLAEVYERQGRMGLMKFVVTQTDWKNQRGELVRINKGTLIYY